MYTGSDADDGGMTWVFRFLWNKAGNHHSNTSHSGDLSHYQYLGPTNDTGFGVLPTPITAIAMVMILVSDGNSKNKIMLQFDGT
jgi:hypothetical protein